MLLASTNTLSSSSSDEYESVYVLTLARLVQHGLKFEEIPLAAVCDLCRKHGDPADLSNEHTLKKHLTGRSHKKRLREELAKLDRALLAEDSTSSSGSASSSSSLTVNYRGNYKGPTHQEGKVNMKPRTEFPPYNASGPLRREPPITFPCANLQCKAKCAAEGRETKTKCTKCGLAQAVPQSGR